MAGYCPATRHLTAVMSIRHDLIMRMQSMMLHYSELQGEHPPSRYFEIVSANNIEAGIMITENLELQVTFKWGHALRLPHTTYRTHPKLRVRHGGGHFHATVYEGRSGQQHGGEKLAIWKPAAIVDEELMRKAVSLVRNVFDAAN